MAQMYGKFVIIKVKEKEQKAAQKSRAKKDAYQDISNQRYFENELTPKQARINRDLKRVDVSIFSTPI